MNLTLTQEKLTTKINSTSSWGDMIRAVESDKRKTLNTDEYGPIKRVTMFEKKRAERIVDPVAMKFRDPEREKDYQAKRDATTQSKVEHARREMESKFNIINHHGPPRKIEVDPPNMLNTGQAREYHILTNMKKQDHSLAPLVYDDSYVQEKTKRPPRTVNFAAPNRREFDVVSNNYYTNNEVRQQEDTQRIREHVENVYWLTHDYDSVKGQYYSLDKETEFQDQRALASSVQGLSQQMRLPPSVRYSEGNSYNILQHTISNAENMKVSGKLSQQGRVTHANEIQFRQREAGITKMELDQERSLNRPNFNRWKSEIDRGYGLIDNLPKEPHLPHPKRPVTVWTRLQESGNAFGTGSNNNSNIRSAGHTPFVFPENGNGSNNNSRSSNNNNNNALVSSPAAEQRPATTSAGVVVKSSNGSGNNNSGTTSRIVSRGNNNNNLPALDLTLTEQPEAVTYKDMPGPPGLPIPILSMPVVRTGGLPRN